MRKIILSLLAAGAIAPACLHAETVGLVLSGGGAKGIAHAGVIQALEDNDIPVDYVTGTSMGAIMGALYVCGYSPDEMMTLLESKDFSYWSTGKVQPKLTYSFASEPASPSLLTLPIDFKKKDKNAPPEPAQSLINPIPMAFAFVELFEAYTAQCGGDFDRLMVPLRTVCSDIAVNHKHVWRSGRLADAVRTSMSFPIVFQPLLLDGRLMYDGGIYDNFPVDVMQSDFNPDFILGIDVGSTADTVPSSVIDQISYLVTRPQPSDVPADKGIKIRINLDEFGLLDFNQAKAIYQKGYDKTMEMMDSIKARVHARRPGAQVASRRAEFKALTPQVAYDAVRVTGGSESQNRFLESLFTPSKGEIISPDKARRGYFAAVSTDQIQNFRVTSDYHPSSRLFTLNLDATIKKPLQASIGGYLTSSANSYLYLGLGYRTVNLHSLDLSIAGWIGQSYQAGALRARFDLASRIPSAIGLEVVASRRDYAVNDRLFFQNEPSFSVNHQYFAHAYWTCPAGRIGTFKIGAGGGRVYNSFYQSADPESFDSGRDHIALNLGRAFASYDSYSLDDINFPTSGHFTHFGLAGYLGNSVFTNTLVPADSPLFKDRRHEAWGQLDIRYRLFLDLHPHWSLGIDTDALLSSRKLLHNYYAAISAASAFTPTAASDNNFNMALRANSYLAAGLIPVYRLNSNLSFRASAYLFAPVQRILDSGTPDHAARYGRAFSSLTPYFEFDAVYRLPFATIAAYASYTDAHNAKLNVGISFGIYLKAPKFY